MTKEEIEAVAAQIKKEVMEEMQKGRRTESKAEKNNKELRKVLSEELGMDEWTTHRVTGAVNVFIKACSGERRLMNIDDRLIEPITNECLNLLRKYLAN